MGAALMPDVTPNCPVHPDVPLQPYRRGWRCPVCERRVLTFRQWPRPEGHAEVATPAADPLLDRLPWIVAPHLAGARDPTRPAAERLDHAVQAAFHAVRLTVLLLLAGARYRRITDPGLCGALGRIALPGWQGWIGLADRLAGEEGLLADDPWSAGLVGGWRSLVSRGVPARLVATPAVPVDGNGASGELTAWVDRVAADAEEIVVTLFGGDVPRLLRVVGREPLRVIVLHGVHADRLNEVEAPRGVPALPEAGILLAEAGGEVWPLEPFLLPGELAAVGPGVHRGEPALALLLPTADGGFYQAAGAPVWLRQDWSQVSPWPTGGDEPGSARVGRQEVAAPAAIHASRIVGRLRRQPWHVGSFLPRPSLEEPLAAALRRPGHGVLLVGEAGAGKTVVLARLAAHLLGEADGKELSPALAGLATNPPGDPDVVAMVSGPQDWGAGSAESGSRVLAQAVARALGLHGARFARLEELLARLDASGVEDRRLGRKVWLLLDGPDESEHGEAVLAALDTALPCLATYPWLRLVVTLDSTTCRRHIDLRGQPGSCFENARHLQVFTDPAVARGQPWLTAAPPSEAELRGWFEHRQKADPSRACPLPFALLPDQTRAALGSPLQVQLFHESGHWLSAGAAGLDLHTLMTGFLVRRSEVDGWSLLDLAEELVHARASGVPLGAAWERWGAWVDQPGTSLSWTHAPRGPLECMLSSELVLGPDPMPWPPDPALRLVTAHPLVAESLVRWALLRDLSPGALPGAEELEAWLGLTPGHWSLRSELAGVLGDLAARLVLADTPGPLDVLLREGDPELAAQALAGALTVAVPLASGGPLRQLWLEAARRSPESASRLARALILAGMDEPRGHPCGELLLGLQGSLVGHTPDDPGPRVALAATLVALAEADGDAVATLRRLREARAHLCELCRRWPARQEHGRLAAVALPWLGEAAAALGHTEEAEKTLRTALPIVRSRVAADPSDGPSRQVLAMTLVTLADLALQAARPVEAERLLEEATVLVGSLRASEPSDREVQRLWGRVALVAGGLAQVHHRLSQAWELLEEAVARLRPLAEPPRHRWAVLDYGLAVARFADLAGQEKRVATARAVLEESLLVLASAAGEPGEAAPALLEAELCWRLAGLAYHVDEERELVLRALRLLQSLAGSPDVPPRWPTLWRSVGDAVRERGWGEPIRPPG
jgi:tetratricopeptide (TPR) repeat protein